MCESDSPLLLSDTEDSCDLIGLVSRRSLSPSDLPNKLEPLSRPQPTNQVDRMEKESDNNDNLVGVMKGSADFEYVSGSAVSSELNPSVGTVEQGPTHSAQIVVDISVPSSPRQTKQRHRLVEKTHKITQLSSKESDRLPDVEFNFIPSSLPVSTHSVTNLESADSVTSKPTSSSGSSMVVTVQSSVKTPSGGASSPALDVQQLILESLQQSSESENVTVYPSKGSVIQNGPKSITISGLPSDKESQKPPAKVRRIEISSKSHLVDLQYVSNATIIPKSSPSTPLSPASMISKGGFTLKQHIAEQGDKPYHSHMTLRGRHSTGSVILSPIMHRSEQLSPDETYSQTMEINTAQHHQKPTSVGSNSARKTQSLSTSPNDYNDDTPEYSVLHGRITRSESLPHEHGSCDSKVKSYAIWETEVGLPANWSSINVDPSTTSQYTTG